MQDVTLILPNYAPDDEVADRALQFLKSLDASLPQPVPMIVVDNGTKPRSEKTVELLMVLADRRHRDGGMYIHFDKPLGYARAVNIGLALADTHYIIVLNNDLTLPLSIDGWSWADELVHEYDSEASGAGPGVLSAMDYSCPPILYDDSWYSLWMSDRDTITKVGYLDESLPFRFHDQDYSIRMYKAGFKVQRTGKVVVGHDEGTTYKKMGVDEGPERDIMLKRHGVLTYADWRRAVGKPLGGGR